MGNQLILVPPRSGGLALHSRAAGLSAHAACKRQTVPARQPRTAPVQPRLLVGPADDPFEREAERTADVVTANGRTGAASVFGGQPLAGSLLRFAQRAPDSKVTDRRGPDKKDEDEKPRKALRSPTPAGGTAVVPAGIEAGLSAMTGGGTPLAEPLRSLFEPRFGLDFSDVRIHTGPEAHGAASELGARAFTVGEHIFFGAGEYQPATTAGQHLLAHELTHTIQQKPGAARAARLLSSAQRVQRAEGEDDGILGTIRGYVTRDFPPWDLITLIIGYDPILERPVKGSTRDWMRAAMKLAPDGEALFEKLDKDGKIDAVAKWWDAEVAKLDLSYAGIVALFAKAWDAVSVTDVFDPLDAWETKIKPIFVPVVQRVWSFIKAVAAKVLQVVRDLVVQKLGDWAKQQRGYPLLTMVLGRDPVTGEAVTPTLKGVIFAVLDLVDGGDKIKENLEKSKAIEKAAAWFKTEAKKLDLTWEGIKLLFAQAWDAFQVADLLNPKLLLEKMWGIFGPSVLRLLTFVTAVGRKVLEFIFEGAMLLAGPIGLQIVGIVRKIGRSFNRIIDDPVAFVGHLVSAVKKGIQLFAKNIWEHLKTGLINWLVGTLEGAGLVLPKVWDLKGILDLVLQILGISYAKIRVKLVKVLGEKTVSLLETAFAFLKTLVTEGPAAAWKEIVAAIGSLWDMVIGGVQDWAVTKIVTAAVTKLATMLNPAGAVIQAIIATYNTIAFFIERIKQIADFVEAVVDSIANVAEGKIAQAAAWVEKAMGRTIPVILGFLARLIGLGDVSGAVKKIITGIQEKVDKGIDAVIAWIVEKAKSLWGSVKDATGKLVEWWKAKTAFQSVDGEKHTLAFEGTEATADLVVRSSPQKMAAFFSRWAAGIEDIKNTTKQKRQQQALVDAKAKYESIKILQKGLALKPAPGADDSQRQKKADALSEELTTLGAFLGLQDIGPNLPFPPPVLPHFTSGVRASSFRATFLSKAVLDTGSETSEASQPESWDIIRANNLSAKAGWVRMHLLPAGLGGKATDSNLVPARGTQTNLVFYREVERPAQLALSGSGADKEAMIWYEAEVSFHPKSETHGSGFPRSIAMSWGGYGDEKGVWKEKPRAKARSYSQGQTVPSLDEFSGRLKINLEGRTRLGSVFGISELYSRRIVELRPMSGFAHAEDFLARVSEYNPDLAKQIAKTAKSPALVTYTMDV